MRRLILAATAAATLMGAASVRAESTDPVLAVVNGGKVHKSDLEAAYQGLPEQYRQMPLEMIYEPLLERVIDSRLLLAEAERRKLAEQPEVQTAIARAREDVLRDSLIERAIAEGSTEERLKGVYESMRSQPGFAFEEVHARHILLGSEAEAREVIKALGEGGDFAGLAQARSTDPSAKTNGGDLGYFRREMMVPEFAEAAFKMEPGAVSADPVQTQFGWHVIKVEDRRQTVPSFEEKEPEIREQVAREIVTALLGDMRSSAEVERFNLDGTPKAQ